MATYSLPGCMAKLTKNFAYLEFPSLGRWPDAPQDGYVPGGSDISSYCCGGGPTKMEEQEADEETPEKAPSETEEKEESEEKKLVEELEA